MSSTIESDIREFLRRIPLGYKSPEDEFFTPVNQTLLPKYKKLGVLSNEEETEEVAGSSAKPVIDCNVPGCCTTFNNIHDYQSHYNTTHKFLCHTCKRSLPTPHLLDLHISETHDSFFQARVDRGDAMYACYLKECNEVMLTADARRKHCMKVHGFPANFRFDKLTTKKAPKTDPNKMEVDMPENATAAKKVKAFTFGHSGDRSFNKKCARKPAGATLDNLDDLKMALEE